MYHQLTQSLFTANFANTSSVIIMDREEKLRAAKEKLKRFQTQKKKPTPDLDSQRSTPKLDEPPLFTAFAPGASNDTNDPFVVQPNNDRSLTSSSVSDQISNVLEAPSIVDVADNELEVIKARLSQLDREKMEMSYTVQQQNLQIQHLIKEAELAVSILLLSHSVLQYMHILFRTSNFPQWRLNDKSNLKKTGKKPLR